MTPHVFEPIKNLHHQLLDPHNLFLLLRLLRQKTGAARRRCVAAKASSSACRAFADSPQATEHTTTLCVILSRRNAPSLE